MSMVFTLRSSDVPTGIYKTKLSDVARTVHAEFGEGLKFSFTITSGEYVGKVVTRVTGNAPTPRNICGRLLAALAGEKAGDGLSVDPTKFIGREYVVTVGLTEAGFSRVNEVVPGTDCPF